MPFPLSIVLGQAGYRERGNRRHLNVEADDLTNTTQSPQAVSVDGAPVGNMAFAPCPIPATQFLCANWD